MTEWTSLSVGRSRICPSGNEALNSAQPAIATGKNSNCVPTWVPTSGERLWDRIPQADWGERDIDELSSPSLARWGE